MPALICTEVELETIAASLEEYKLHDDPDADPADLIGGIPVAERVAIILSKIDALFATK